MNLTWIDVDPSEVASWKQLRHCPTIKIVGVEVLRVFGFFIGIVEISYLFIVRRCISMDSLHYPSSNSSLKH